jgi:hypothetical protein
MNKVNLLEAWRIWFSEGETRNLTLWGLKILWWGRIGKVVQLIAALTILAEIIGPERLRVFSKSLRTRVGVRVLKHILNEWGGDKDTKPIISLLAGYLSLAAVVVWNFYILYTTWEELSSYSFFKIVISLLLSSIIVAIISFGALIFVILFYGLPLAVLLAAIDVLFITPIAWVLEKPYLVEGEKVMRRPSEVIGQRAIA